MPHVPLDINWKQWEKVDPNIDLFEDAYMRRQTWFDDWDHTYHIALWENPNDTEHPVSLILTRVDKIGDSPYKQTSRTIGYSDKPVYWPELDRFFGSRRTWSGIINSFRAHIKNS